MSSSRRHAALFVVTPENRLRVDRDRQIAPVSILPIPHLSPRWAGSVVPTGELSLCRFVVAAISTYQKWRYPADSCRGRRRRGRCRRGAHSRRLCASDVSRGHQPPCSTRPALCRRPPEPPASRSAGSRAHAPLNTMFGTRPRVIDRLLDHVRHCRRPRMIGVKTSRSDDCSATINALSIGAVANSCVQPLLLHRFHRPTLRHVRIHSYNSYKMVRFEREVHVRQRQRYTRRNRHSPAAPPAFLA